MNARAKLSSKGQLVIPKSVRDAHGWTEGTEFEFVVKGKSVELQPVDEFADMFPPTTWEEFDKKRVKIDFPFPSDEEMEEAILAEAARRFDATRR